MSVLEWFPLAIGAISLAVLGGHSTLPPGQEPVVFAALIVWQWAATIRLISRA